MRNELLKLINEFGSNLSPSRYDQYIPKLRDYFIPYILNEKKHITSINRLFSSEFTLGDISNSTVYYVENNEGVECLSAITDYLIALNQFFEDIIYKYYSNPTLATHKSFTSLYKEIESEIISKGIELRESEANPSLEGDDVQNLLEFLSYQKTDSCTLKQCKCIVKLFLLYGFSTDKLAKFRKDDFDITRNTLKVPVKNTFVYLELPHSLTLQLSDYIKTRDIESDLLFVKTTGNPITTGYTIDFFKKVLSKYPNTYNEKNRFTNTGVQKYALRQMILKGMNTSIITAFTGQQGDILGDCQAKVNESQQIKRNRYINHMIRGIETYDII